MDRLAAGVRLARLLFERRRLMLRSETAAGADPRLAEPSPSATALGGAPGAAAAIEPAIAGLRSELFAAVETPNGDEPGEPFALLRWQFSLDAAESELLLVLAAYQLEPALQAMHRAAVEGAPARLSVGFLSGLISPTLAARLETMSRLAPAATLRRYQLARVGEADQGPGLGGRSIELCERTCAYLGGDFAFDPRLAATAKLVSWPADAPALPYPDELRASLESAWHLAGEAPADAPRRLLLHGPDAGGKQALLAELAGREGRTLLAVDLGRVAALYQDPDVSLQEHLREAVLQGAVLYLDAHNTDALKPVTRLHFAEILAGYSGVAAIGFPNADFPPLSFAGESAWIKVAIPDAYGRQQLWEQFLSERQATLPPEEMMGDVAQRFLLGYDAIEAAAAESALEAAVTCPGSAPGFEQLSRAARRRQTHQLGKWAQRIERTGRWEDLIAPDEVLAGLRDMVVHVRHAEQVFVRWGFGRRSTRGTGLSALFHGPPGTGKTMAASLVAQQLGQDLFRVDLSKVTSMWIGETEKHLGELFDQAAAGQAVLLFDEADSLFAKRTEVRTSVDRYANLTVNYLLQRIEEFPGVGILTTNRPENIDEAFKRRLRFQLEFPLPAPDQRRALWTSMIPSQCAVAKIDFRALAQKYEIGGGHIQNAILRAAFEAAEAGGPMTHEMLLRAADAEYQGMGKLVRTG